MASTPGKKPTHCAPKRYEKLKETGTCLAPSDVTEVARSVGLDPIGKPLRQLVGSIHSMMGTNPGQEEKWLSSPTVKRWGGDLVQRITSSFRPVRPRSWSDNPNTWLNTYDIEHVLNQYQESHRAFKFVGVFPRDFATRTWTGRCVSPPMCSLSVAELKKEGRDEFGIVFNMDTHDQKGSHWTACYGCINPRKKKRFGIWYYDSVGTAPPKEITAFMKAFAADVGGGRTGFVVDRNRVRRQFGNTECGIFSLFFIVVCLTTRRSFDDICRNVMGHDATMNRLRKVFYRDPA